MYNQPETFSIAVRKFAPFEFAIQKLWDDFCRFSGCNFKLQMVVMDLHELYQTTIADKGLVNGNFDIAHINTDWIYEAYLANAVQDLTSYITQNPPDTYPKGWSSSLLVGQQFNAQTVGLPFHDGPECFIYRKDLFEDEQEQANYIAQYGKPLTIPKNWEDFRQIARFFHRPANNLYGSIFACYPDGHNTVFDFCLQLWTRGGSLINDEGQININTKAADEALDFYRDIVKDELAVHPGSANFDSVAAGLAFMNGESAMMINWFGFAAMCEVDGNSKVKGKINVDLLPSNPNTNTASLNVYWLYTIAKGSKHKQLAYDFIRFAINEENDKQLTLAGGIGCRISTWNDPEINTIIPYYHKLEQLHKVANMLPQTKNWAKIAIIIDEMVLKAIRTTNPTNEILAQAQTKINLIA